jgi:DNA-binding GntR family transcriptional regulator
MANRLGKNKKVAVYKNLKNRIITCELSPGMPINEAYFANDLGVSTTPIREALRQLEQEGLVENVPGRGSIISNISSKDISGFFGLREFLESAAARKAALMKDKTIFEAKKTEIIQHSAYIDNAPESVYDWRPWEDVHETIVNALRNQKLTVIFEGLMDHIKRIRNYIGNQSTARPRDELLSEHLEILEAIIEGDPERAERAVRYHLNNPVSFGVGVISSPNG